MYHIQIAGAGYLGSRIADYFQQKKQKVTALVHSAASVEKLKSRSISALSVDLLNSNSLTSIPPANFIVISVAPRDYSMEGYRNIYLDGIKNYLSALAKHPKPFLIVYISSTGIYSEDNGNWVDADILPNPKTEKARILLAAENQVLQSGYPACILRLSGIYGPARNRIEKIKQGTIPEKNVWTNLIHVDDAVSMIPILFKSAKTGNIYLGTDNQPFTQQEFLDWLCPQLNVSIPDLESKNLTGKRCSNQKLKELGWKPSFSTFKEGYSSLLSL